MDPKARPNDELYYDILERMTPSQRLEKAMELSDLTKELFRAGLKDRFPDASREELHRIFLQELALCHNSNY